MTRSLFVDLLRETYAASGLDQGQTPPPLLYHYTSATGLHGILLSGGLWATHIHHLNDKKEFLLALDLAQALLKQSNQASRHRELLDAVEKRFNDLRYSNLFVVSLSEDGNLLSQWRAYTPKRGGFSVGLDTQVIMDRTTAEFATFAPCIYSPENQSRLLGRLVQFLFDSAETEDREPMQTAFEFVTLVVQIAPLLKHRSFFEEKEWRIILGPYSSSAPFFRDHLQFRSGSDTLIPYLSFGLCSAQSEEIGIRKIIIGPSPDPELNRYSAKLLLASRGISGCDVEDSQSPYRGW